MAKIFNPFARKASPSADTDTEKAPQPKKAPTESSFKTMFAALKNMGGFNLQARTSFAKRLSFLIDAGVPITEALHILREQAIGKKQTEVLDQIVSDVSSGQSLSKSFAKFPKFFDDFAIHIIRVGESSGTLSQCLTYLANELKKKEELKKKVVGAFIYPAVLSSATVGIIVFLMVYLFPKIMPIFSSLHSKLPLSTKIVIALSTFLQHFGWLVALIIIVLVIIYIVVMKRSAAMRYKRDKFLIKLPIIGSVVRYYNCANACRTLGLLLKSGIRLSEALPITADTTRNLVYRRLYEELGEAVTRGEAISIHLLKSNKYFPDMMGHMVAVGERSGSLSDTLVYLSDMYDGEVDDFTKNISTLIEPVLMVFMGVVIGFIAISIITPIYGITQSIHG